MLAGPGHEFDHGAAVRGCAAGDEAALKALYDAEAAAMLGVALRIVRRRDLAEEAVHDAFLQIWRKAHQYDAALGSGRAWMFAIVRNRALNIVRDRSREDLVDDGALETLQADHDETLLRLPERDALRRCLEQLDKPRRTSLMLAYVSGFSHGEIAGRLGVPLGTAKAWIRRSLLALKECMA